MSDPNPTLSAKKSNLLFDFKFGFSLPWTFRFLGALAVIGSLALMVDFNWIGVPLFIIGIVVLFAYEGAEIDQAKKVYREYTSFLLFKTGKFISYDSIDQLHINKKQEKQRMYSTHTNQSSVFTNEVYDVYLKFSTGKKIHLLSKKSKESLLKHIQAFSKSLHIQIVDNT